MKLRGLGDVRVRWFSYRPPCPTELTLAQVSSTSRCRQCDAGRFSPTEDGRGWQLRVVRLLEQHGTCLFARRFSCGHLGQQLGLFLAATTLALPTVLRVLSVSTRSLFSTLDACAAMRLPTAFVSSACSSGRPRTSAVSQESTSISSTRPVARAVRKLL